MIRFTLLLFFVLIFDQQAEGGIFSRRVVRRTVVAAGVVRDSVSNAYQVALASASQRAATRRKGHLMSVEAGYTVGVGWSSFDSQPNTCFGRGGAGYAVVRGADGWYSTKVVR